MSGNHFEVCTRSEAAMAKVDGGVGVHSLRSYSVMINDEGQVMPARSWGRLKKQDATLKAAVERGDVAIDETSVDAPSKPKKSPSKTKTDPVEEVVSDESAESPKEETAEEAAPEVEEKVEEPENVNSSEDEV